MTRFTRLDPSLFQTQIEQSRANLIRAEADLDRLNVALADARTKLARAEELWSRHLIAQTELDSAHVAVRSAEAQVRSSDAQVTQAQASLNQSEVNLQHTVITAPIDGIVISRNVDVGQTVAASMQAPTLFVIAADLADMQVIASLDESDIGRIAPGQAVTFTVDAYPGDSFTGSVVQVRLQPNTTQGVVTYSTVIDVPNPDLELKPGMTASVTIETARRDDVVRVPNPALRFRPSAEVLAALGEVGASSPQRVQGIWTLMNGQLLSVPVRVGLSDGLVSELLEGSLEPGAEVVTAVSTSASTSARPTATPTSFPFGMPAGGGGGGFGGRGQ